ncbi:hypothetical protein [Bradyrhizobium sp. USDA 4506]
MDVYTETPVGGLEIVDTGGRRRFTDEAKARFCWPRIGHHRVQLNAAQLMALVDGMDWKRVRAAAVKPPEIVG